MDNRKYRNAYDSCQAPNFMLKDALVDDVIQSAMTEVAEHCSGSDVCYALGTNWSLVWAFNSSLMFI